MPWTISKISDYGISNPVVARLSLQTLSILKHCKATDELKEKIGTLYTDDLMKTILSCYEITERYRTSFNTLVAAYERPNTPNAILELPQIPNLDKECRDFVYAAKNVVRDILRAFNIMFSTKFSEASEFYEEKKNKKLHNDLSLLDFAKQLFGEHSRC